MRIAMLCVVMTACATDLSSQTSELGGTCVPYVGHWRFWGECSNDVPLAPGSAVYSLSSGQVVTVYASCGGYAGRSVRVDAAKLAEARTSPNKYLATYAEKLGSGTIDA